MNVFFHSGDLGDCIACLPVMRQLGGGRLILGNRNGKGAREPMTPARFNAIAPLLRAQEYITKVQMMDDPPMREGDDGTDDQLGVTHDFHNFRTKCQPRGKGCGELGYNLATWQANYFGITNLDLSPWLEIKAEGKIKKEEVNRAVVSRSLRYQNPGFPWAQYLNEHPNPIFVGLQEEYRKFPCMPGMFEYRSTENLLQVAEVIAGSSIFIGNQSAPCWIALGLGHPLIQEMDVDVVNRNSVIERENAKYVS